jgi:hypothetical protein
LVEPFFGRERLQLVELCVNGRGKKGYLRPEKHLVWKSEGKVAGISKMTIVNHSTFYGV